MRGIEENDLQSIIEFMYTGITKVNQENVQLFMSIAKEFKLDGLSTGNIKEISESKK